METDLTNKPADVTSDEKLLAMLAHLSIVLGGIILPIILWATQKDKSKFVRFHSLQAIFYHISYAVIIIIFVIIFALVMIISGVGFGAFPDSHHGKNGPMPVFMIIMLILFYLGLFVVIISGIAYAIYVAVKAYQGKLIKIPIIGKIIYRKVYGEG